MTRTKTLIALLATTLLLAGAAAAADAPRITKEDAKKLLGAPNTYFLDARAGVPEPERIKGSVRVDPENVRSWAGNYKKDAKLIVYCS